MSKKAQPAKRLVFRNVDPADADVLQRVADAMKVGNEPFVVLCDGVCTLAVGGEHVRAVALKMMESFCAAPVTQEPPAVVVH
jgi:hypothetical protein